MSAVAISAVVIGLAQVATSALPPQVQAWQRTREALQTSVKQVKARPGGDPRTLAALEQQYTALVASVEKWSSAALSNDASVRRGADSLARDTSRAMARFGRDARTYVSGQEGPLLSSTVSRFENELKDAARALSRMDDAARQSLAGAFQWAPWAAVQ